MATERVKEMMNMMPQMMQGVKLDPTELMEQTQKAWTRSFELVNQMTSTINDELWTQSIKSLDETQKIYRTNLETWRSWTDTWRNQAEQNVQRFVEMANSPWR